VAPARVAASLRGWPGGLLRDGLSHSAALVRGRPQLLGRRILGLAQAVSAKQEQAETWTVEMLSGKSGRPVLA
jgi:hypothetical protein